MRNANMIVAAGALVSGVVLAIALPGVSSAWHSVSSLTDVPSHGMHADKTCDINTGKCVSEGEGCFQSIVPNGQKWDIQCTFQESLPSKEGEAW
jgi:hypothetical protein